MSDAAGAFLMSTLTLLVVLGFFSRIEALRIASSQGRSYITMKEFMKGSLLVLAWLFGFLILGPLSIFFVFRKGK